MMMTERPVSPELRADLRAAISNAYYEARNKGLTMEDAADRATEAVLVLVKSVDENAHQRGRAEARVQKVASIITDYWPHRMSTAAATAIDAFYRGEFGE